LTLGGQVLGTPAYMPPEQAEGDLDRVDQVSDVYGVAAILYEVMTGVAPYHPLRSPYSIIEKLKAREMTEPPVLKDTGLPPDLSQLCMKGMAAEKRDRYQTIDLLRNEIRKWRDGEAVAGYKYTIKQSVKRFALRNKAAVAMGAAAVVTLVAALTISLMWTASQRRHQASDLVAQARELNDQGKLMDAQAKLNQATALDSDNKEAAELQASVTAAIGKLETERNEALNRARSNEMSALAEAKRAEEERERAETEKKRAEDESM